MHRFHGPLPQRLSPPSPLPGLRRWHGWREAMASRSKSDSPSRTRAPSESDLRRIRVGPTRIGGGSRAGSESFHLPGGARHCCPPGRPAYAGGGPRRRRLSLPTREGIVRMSPAPPTPLRSSCPMPVGVQSRASSRSALDFFRRVAILKIDVHSRRQTRGLRSIAGREGGCRIAEQR